MAMFYIIKSKMNGFCLDIEKAKAKEGQNVCMWEQHGGENQIFLDDPATGTIRAKMNHKLCLTFNGEHLILHSYQAGNKEQQWMRQGETIRNRVDPTQVLDIYRKNKDKGAKVGSYAYKGGVNQHWEFVPVEGQMAGVTSAYYLGQKKQFFIRSLLSGKVLDVQGEKTLPGAKIIMYEQHADNEANQLWYLDNLGFIRSSLSDLVPWNKAKGDQLVTAMPGTDPRGQWLIQGNKIQSRANEYMDISRSDKSNSAKVISWELNDQENQHWEIIYL